MKVTTRKTSNGLLLQATEKDKSGKTITRPLKKLPDFLASSLAAHNSVMAHEQWVTDEVERLCKHYDVEEGLGDDEMTPAYAVEFFIRDAFYGDPQAMREVVVQCIDWLEGIHGIKLSGRSGGRR